MGMESGSTDLNSYSICVFLVTHTYAAFTKGGLLNSSMPALIIDANFVIKE